MPPGSVLVVPSWRRIFVVAPLAAAKPMRALSRLSSTPNRMFQWRRKDIAIQSSTKFSTTRVVLARMLVLYHTYMVSNYALTHGTGETRRAVPWNSVLLPVRPYPSYEFHNSGLIRILLEYSL
jgi:hypothetical protein